MFIAAAQDSDKAIEPWGLNLIATAESLDVLSNVTCSAAVVRVEGKTKDLQRTSHPTSPACGLRTTKTTFPRSPE